MADLFHIIRFTLGRPHLKHDWSSNLDTVFTVFTQFYSTCFHIILPDFTWFHPISPNSLDFTNFARYHLFSPWSSSVQVITFDNKPAKSPHLKTPLLRNKSKNVSIRLSLPIGLRMKFYQFFLWRKWYGAQFRPVAMQCIGLTDNIKKKRLRWGKSGWFLWGPIPVW